MFFSVEKGKLFHLVEFSTFSFKLIHENPIKNNRFPGLGKFFRDSLFQNRLFETMIFVRFKQFAIE